MVRNTTRVLPARLYGVKDSGGRVELMLERVLDSTRALVQLRASKATPPGRRLDCPGGASARVLARHDAFTEVEFDRPVVAYLEAFGEIPLPPYIRRAGQATDRERYQTVYSREPGAVAAPTAGLHFDQAMFDRLASLGVRTAEVTLHVGAGTFAPLREERLEGVQLHAEWVEVRQATIDAIAATQARGGRVIAIGTTVVRSLEAAALSGQLRPLADYTRLFIRPGFKFHVVDAMVTNFHLSESSLLMLVCAFAGRESVLQAYQHAVSEKYRFFSYGDAMFVTPAPGVRS